MEKLWPTNRVFPSELQINVNVNFVNLERKDKTKCTLRFIHTVNYNPSVAMMSIRGVVNVEATEEEIKEIMSKKLNQIPARIMQATTNFCIANSVILSQVLGVPPPLPSFVSKPDVEAPVMSRNASVYI